jgi:Zn-dependent metalloprotease
MGGQARVSISDATGAANFVGLRAGFQGDLMPESPAGARQKARAFVDEYSRMLGLSGDVTLVGESVDKLGMRHVTFEQSYRGVPVFAGMVRAHVEGDGRLVAVNGSLIPGIRVNPSPTRSAAEAAATAISLVSSDLGGREVFARSGILMVYRTGLAQGIDGESYLAWQIEVGNGSDIREFLFVDAHSGKVIDRLPGIMEDLDRRAFDGEGANPGPNYPANPFWVEGQVPFPTGNLEADNMIIASEETYNFFDESFGRDSFDGAGATMDAIFNRGGVGQCPNASWNGTFISFCPGLTTDDVTAHEWGHAYTQYTHNLIYAWQPGALNESYSDIWGETVDRINNRDDIGNSATDPLRTGASTCTIHTQQPPVITVNAPAAIAGPKLAGTAAFGPAVFDLTENVVVVNDGVGVGVDGCETPFVNAAAVAGKIALVDRGVCGFVVKAKNAQVNGAIGVIVGNNTTGIINMGGVDPTVVIPSLSIGQADATAIKAQVGTVNATMTRIAGTGTDASTRWLLGEDDTAAGLTGALRDMYAPPCYFNPAKVSDAFYGCGAADNGGVHNNSGVPNHAFALIVDGGTYNGQTISGIGLTKAAHVYFRAASVYQHSATSFAEHADAIEQSAADLLGVNLPDLTTGAPSGQIINSSDITEIEQAMLAVEMRTPPSQCNFQPLLAQSPPALCTTGNATQLFHDGFNNDSHWSMSHEGTTPDFTERDWVLSADLPDERSGKALFGPNPDIGTCAPGGDETAVLHADSKKITIPASVSNPRLTFVHWVATEAGWDGGNVKISVNDGPWTLIPASAFIYNAYNTTLQTVGAGNTNPLAGQPAFSGTDGGAVDGTWGRSIVDLTGIAKPKDKVKLRFSIGNDGCTGRFGWYIDDVMVYRCH